MKGYTSLNSTWNQRSPHSVGWTRNSSTERQIEVSYLECPQLLQTKPGIAPRRPLPSSLFSIYYSLIIPPFEARQLQVLMASTDHELPVSNVLQSSTRSPNIFLHTSFRNTAICGPVFLLSVNYKITGACKSLGSWVEGQKVNDSETFPEFKLLPSSLWWQFWFITVVSTYGKILQHFQIINRLFLYLYFVLQHG